MSIIIVDLEATCEKTQKIESEIIEIGAIKDDGNKFQSFVRPFIHPILSDFCKELTHIKQEDVDNAETFDIVIQNFIKWVGNDPLYSWGNYDKNQFIKDCKRWGIDWEFRHLNLKVEFSKIKKIKRRGVKGALRYLGLKFEGEHHRALPDSLNIFRIYNIIKKEISTPETLVRTLDKCNDD